MTLAIFILAAVAALILAVIYVHRRWVEPWREIDDLVQSIGDRTQPRKFLVTANEHARSIGLALEKLATKQTDLERAAAEGSHGLRNILAALPDGVAIVDQEHRVQLMNPRFGELFSINETQTGASVLEIVRDVTVDRALTAAFERGDLQVAPMTVNREPDVRRELEISIVPFKSAEAGNYGAVMLFRDITQMREVEQMRKDFVANVSHELRTPLSILRGYIETVLDDPAISTDELRRILQVMERHSKRLGLLVQDLLTLAQLESATPNLQLAEINVDELITSVTRDWGKRLARKNLKIDVDLAPRLPTVHADESRLHEVLYNLLDNALKYSRDGDEVRLTAQQRDGEVVISVTDTGIGIAREDLPRIFERFFRTDKARSREMGGTGLGLAIVKHIVQLHEGRVEAESELGKGTTIRVVLPASDPKSRSGDSRAA